MISLFSIKKVESRIKQLVKKANSNGNKQKMFDEPEATAQDEHFSEEELESQPSNLSQPSQQDPRETEKVDSPVTQVPNTLLK